MIALRRFSFDGSLAGLDEVIGFAFRKEYTNWRKHVRTLARDIFLACTAVLNGTARTVDQLAPVFSRGPHEPGLTFCG